MYLGAGMIQSVSMLALDTAAVVTRPGQDSDTSLTLKTIRGRLSIPCLYIPPVSLPITIFSSL